MNAIRAWGVLLAAAWTLVLGTAWASAAEEGAVGEPARCNSAYNPVPKALDWLARHQMPDGSWSLTKFDARCTDKTCTGPGSSQRSQDMAATAMGL